MSRGIKESSALLPNYYRLLPRSISTTFAWLRAIGALAAIVFLFIWSSKTAGDGEFIDDISNQPGIIRIPLAILYFIVTLAIATWPWNAIVVGVLLVLQLVGAGALALWPHSKSPKDKQKRPLLPHLKRRQDTINAVEEVASRLGAVMKYQDMVFEGGCWLLFGLRAAPKEFDIKALDEQLHGAGYCIQDRSGGTLYVGPYQPHVTDHE